MTKLLSPAKTVIAVPAKLTPEQCWAEVAPAGPAGAAGAAKAGVTVPRAARARRGRHLLDTWKAAARKHGVPPHAITAWVRRKMGANVTVLRVRCDGSLGCATPCVLCQRALRAFDVRVSCSQGAGAFWVGRLTGPGAPAPVLTSGQRRVLGHPPPPRAPRAGEDGGPDAPGGAVRNKGRKGTRKPAPTPAPVPRPPPAPPGTGGRAAAARARRRWRREAAAAAAAVDVAVRAADAAGRRPRPSPPSSSLSTSRSSSGDEADVLPGGGRRNSGGGGGGDAGAAGCPVSAVGSTRDLGSGDGGGSLAYLSSSSLAWQSMTALEAALATVRLGDPRRRKAAGVR